MNENEFLTLIQRLNAENDEEKDVKQIEKAEIKQKIENQNIQGILF